MRPSSIFAAALVCWLAGQAALAADASPWAAGHHARARLLAGGQAGGARLAAVEIALDRGFKTYWRHPGEAGLPPAFDWSGSANLGAVEVLWPAPRRFQDAGGVSYGYEGGVVLPVRVTPREADRPVRLALKLDYGVCKDICIPVRADLALALGDGQSVRSPAIERALAQVPQRRAIGQDGELAILKVKALVGAGKPGLAVVLRAPSGDAPQLFAEAPDGWFLATPAGVPGWPADGPAGGAATIPVTVEERPADAAGTVAIRLTVTSAGRAIESEATLDAADLTPSRPRLDGATAPR